jgi:conjugal transfer pilus assembly protein TraF
MRNLLQYISWLLIGLLTCSFASATTQTAGNGLDLEPVKKGFYWYEEDEPVEEPEPEPESEIIPVPVVVSPQPAQREQDGKTYDELWVTEADAFAALLDNRQKMAIQYPTEENVYLYLQAQDVAKRKSGAFAGVMGLVAQLHPEFSNENIYPTNVPGQKVYVKNRQKNDDEFLNTFKKDFALLVFTSEGCDYCKAQKPILDLFFTTYGWDIQYLDINQYRSIADKYSITMTPSILAIAKNVEDAMPISSGYITLPELKKRLIRTVRVLTGDNEPEQFYRNERSTDTLKFVSE